MRRIAGRLLLCLFLLTPSAVLAESDADRRVDAESPGATAQEESVEEPRERYIVQAESLEIAQLRVEEVGGVLTHELRIIRAVGAELTEDQAAALSRDEGLRLFEDRKVATESASADDASAWSDAFVWSDMFSQVMSVGDWVEQE